jgi:hypothetical protein
LTTAIIFGVTGVLWHFPRVTRTDGIIVESVAVAGAQNKRLITYEYTAYGARHRGQRLLGWGRSIPPAFFDVGQPFPVYFDTDKPDFSYAPYPPEKTIFIVFSNYLRSVGGWSYFVWIARPTNNESMNSTAPVFGDI